MKPELLAPANLRTLTAAVQAGADAVYLGGTNFGARKFADNFVVSELEKAVDYCHLRGVKVYLTSNILVSDNEISEFLSFVTQAYNMGVDAFILQDMGMAKLIREHLPQAKLHASTQMTVHNTQGAAFMKNLGFERVVTARELSKEDINDIVAKSGIEIEIFVHGALCMSYSGQCLMSSMIGGRSGNRGSCAQPCRLPYDVSCGGKLQSGGYFLSPRDLSLAGNMTDILNSGVASLKIEGRMKGPEYVAASVSILRRLIDEERNCTPDELVMLENAFSRDGFTSGMYGGDYERYINSRLSNDDIYKNRDETILKSLKEYTAEAANTKKIPVSFKAEAYKNTPFRLAVNNDEFGIELEGEIVQEAKNKPTDRATIEKQIVKTGDYPFFASEIEVYTDGESFLPLSDITGLRRQCLDRLSEKIVSSAKKNENTETYNMASGDKKSVGMNFGIIVTDEKQLEAVRKKNAGQIFVPCRLNPRENEVALFPDIIHNGYLDNYLKMLEETKSGKICTSNYAIIERAKELGKKIITAPSLNVFNSESVSFWHENGAEEIILSQELNIKQIEKLTSEIPVGVIVYGKTVMMKTAVCPVRSAFKKCGGEKCRAFLKDRKKEKFPVICNGMTTFILNSKPIYMADKLFDLEKAGVSSAVIHFTDELPEECVKVIDAYMAGEKPGGDFTRGHFYRGVTGI